MLERGILHEAKFTEVNKRDESSLKSYIPESTSQLWACRHCDQRTGRPQENKIFRFLKIHKKSIFNQIKRIFRRSSLHEI